MPLLVDGTVPTYTIALATLAAVFAMVLALVFANAYTGAFTMIVASDSTSGNVNIWGAQLEKATYAAPYIGSVNSSASTSSESGY